MSEPDPMLLADEPSLPGRARFEVPDRRDPGKGGLSRAHLGAGAKRPASRPWVAAILLAALAISYIVPQMLLVEHIYRTDGQSPLVGPPEDR